MRILIFFYSLSVSNCDTKSKVAQSALNQYSEFSIDGSTAITDRYQGNLDCFSAKQKNDANTIASSFDFCYPNIIVSGIYLFELRKFIGI